MAARKQTNEGVEGMTLDGFAQKLRENEAALQEEARRAHGALQGVVKNGQTTLKPFPIQ